MTSARRLAIAVVLVAGVPAARGDGTSGALASVKLGSIVPFDGLSPFVTIGVEGGYFAGRFAIVLAVDYTQPDKTGSEMDPRVPGGTYGWKLTEQELAIMPVVLYRSRSAGIAPYVGIGPRILLVRSIVQSNGGATIAQTEERSTLLGVGVPVGAELALGPGRAIAELLVQYAGLHHTTTGDTSTAAATIAIGYRVLL